MITRCIQDGVLFIASVFRYNNEKRRTARFYRMSNNVPETILKEVDRDVFLDEVNHKKFLLTPLGFSRIY